VDAHAREVAVIQQAVQHVGAVDVFYKDDDLHVFVYSQVSESGIGSCRVGGKEGLQLLLKLPQHIR